jgi:hypothetical protein
MQEAAERMEKQKEIRTVHNKAGAGNKHCG